MQYSATTNESASSDSNRIGTVIPGKLWIEPERLVEVPDGAVVLAFCPIRNSAVVERHDVLWIELDRLVEVLDGAVVLAFVRVLISTAGMEGCNVSGDVLRRSDCPRACRNGRIAR
jgi:hypothetical protein